MEMMRRMGTSALTVLLTLYVACLPGCRGLCPVHCSNSTGVAIRLVLVPSLSSVDSNVGRLEVCCSNKWGTVALKATHNFWSEKNVQVACMQLGFSGGLNSILPAQIPVSERPPQSVPVNYVRVACNGSEELLSECSKSSGILAESHATDVYIVCRPRDHDFSSVHKAGPQDGDVRLFGSYSSGEGGVELYTSGRWSMICPDSSWTNTDARLLCTALGYELGVAKLFDNDRGYQPTLFNARCSGPTATPTEVISGEVSTKFCTFSSGTCKVSSNEVAGIQCSSKGSTVYQTFRLFGVDLFDSLSISGVLEVFESQRWGMVCSDKNRPDGRHIAAIICRTIFNKDFSHAQMISLPSDSLSRYESNMKPLWVDGVTCPGDALSINDCVFKEPIGYSNCSHRELLAVRCDVQTSPAASSPFIIVGGVFLGLVGLVAMVIFLAYLRRVFSHRDRVSVTSMVPLDSGSHDGPVANGNGHATFVHLEDSQLDEVKLEESRSDARDYGAVQLDHRHVNC